MLLAYLLLPLLVGAAVKSGDDPVQEAEDDTVPENDEPEQSQEISGPSLLDYISGAEIDGDDSDEYIEGTADNDLIDAKGGHDTVRAGAGVDTVHGGEGDDRLIGNNGTDSMEGGEGNDFLKGGAGSDVLWGQEGDDTLLGGLGNDLMAAGTGADLLLGHTGDDFLYAIDGGDNLGAPDTLDGGAGMDRLWGDDGDILIGGDGVTLFEVAVGVPDADPVIIKDLKLFHAEGDLSTDLISLLDTEGNLIPYEGLVGDIADIVDAPNGQDAHIIYDSQIVAVVEGYSAEDLIADTNWVGNFSPHLTERLDGDDSITGDTSDNVLFGGGGDDTISGGDGSDYLIGNEGDDLLDGVDSLTARGQGDYLEGGEGADTLRGDDGDILAGQEGHDLYEIVIPQTDQDALVEIHGFELRTEDGTNEILSLVNPDGSLVSADDVAANLVIYQAEDGSGALLEYDGHVIGHMFGVDADIIQDQSKWIGNFSPTPDDNNFAPVQGNSDTTINMTLQNINGTGLIVTPQMFGSNMVYSVNTESGIPLENYASAADALETLHLRIPAGQGDPDSLGEDGVEWLNVVEMKLNDQGEMDIRPEVKTMLEAVIEADAGREGDVRVTLVLPTKFLSAEEYVHYADDIEAFAQKVMEDYGDVIEAFEIGNEYWVMGETAYGTKANIAAIAVEKGLEAAGIETDDQPSIIVQMATPNSGSEYHSSVDDRPFGARRDDANQTIIDQLSEEARDAIDGVVEHYYYKQPEDVFEDSSLEQGFINEDYRVWDENFDKELDMHITEWNVRTSNFAQNGMKSAGILFEQMDRMINMGADAAHTWPLVHNTTSHLAGTRTDMPILDDEGRVLNSVRGAAYDTMSSTIVGMEYVETEFSGDDGRVEVNAYQSSEKVVFHVASRTDEPIQLDLDVSGLVTDFDSATGILIGYDQSSTSSDGVYLDKEKNTVQADFVTVDGERYYLNEHDVRATITDLTFDDTEMVVRLKPFEAIQITFELSEDDVPSPPPAETGQYFAGSDQADSLEGTNGNDTMDGFAGNDTILGEDGHDHVYGGDGNDNLKGGKGDDFVRGQAGDDGLYGWGGDDDMKGGDGDDTIAGNEGNDTLSGSEGQDLLRGEEGSDEMNGGIGHDRLDGGEGLDFMTGWSGDDVFFFEDGDMQDGDVIMDFEIGKDMVELSYADITDMNDLTFSQVSVGVVMRVGDHGAVLFKGDFTPEQLAQPGNFQFLDPAA